MSRRITRRTFLKGSAIGVSSFLFLKDSRSAFGYPENEKLNVAGIGAGGKGHSGISGCNSENIVALCDVDWDRASGAFKDWPDAKRYYDFRRMFDEMADQIDAVVVSTPDHTHAVASVQAMRLGKHVYCEKPLTHSVYEARLMRDTARRMKVATQMGNQGTSDSGLRENVEIIQAGMLGPVHEVHVWSNRPIWPQGIERPKETPAVPETLKWDLWLGPAAERPYNPAYLPFVWRGWVPFGTGALGDMGCHTLNMPYMALKLDNPISVEAEVFESPDPLESYPKKSIIRYAFPARGDMPPAKLTWYDGGLKPSPELLGRTELSGSGCAVIGEKGILLTGSDYGGGREFYPAERYADFTPPPQKLPRSPGHHEEWLRACKGGEPAMSNFDYAVGLTEMVLLGNLAIVTGERIYFDPARMTAINCPKADEYIHPTFRKGWTL